MKRALYYAIRTGSLYNPVIAVTLEKQHRWYGRDLNDMPTNGVLSDLSGKFDTREEAVSKREAIAKVADRYDDLRKQVAKVSNSLFREERDAIAKLIAGEEVGPIQGIVMKREGL